MGTGLNVSDNDLYSSMLRCYKKGGAIFYDRVPAGSTNATATGTGTARASITTSYLVPPISAELLAISPTLAPTAAAAADTQMAFADIQGTAFKKQPQQVPAPVSGVLLSVGAYLSTPKEWWTVRAPVVPGDAYDWGITPLKANTHNMKAAMDLMYSTVPSGDPVIYSQVQTTVNTFLSAAGNSGGTLQLTAALGLYEAGVLWSPETAAVAQENQILSTQITCAAFNPIQTFTIGEDVPGVVVSTSGVSTLQQISRYMPLGITSKISNPTINYTHNLNVATTNNITTANYMRYTATG